MLNFGNSTVAINVDVKLKLQFFCSSGYFLGKQKGTRQRLRNYLSKD
jgi:hypothetical protein